MKSETFVCYRPRKNIRHGIPDILNDARKMFSQFSSEGEQSADNR